MFQSSKSAQSSWNGLLPLICIFAILSSSVPSLAQYTEVVNDIRFKCDVKNGTAIAAKYDGRASTVTIPATVRCNYTGSGKQKMSVVCKVTQVGPGTGSALTSGAAKTTLRRVVIESGVPHIERQAFAGTRSLESISIPSSVTSIGRAAFNQCESLREITLPPNVRKIEESTFRECYSLLNVQLHENLYEIEAQAFSNCEALKFIAIPKSVKRLERATFVGCVSLERIQLPDFLEFIGPSAFVGCKNLQSIILPETVKEVGPEAFKGCDSLQIIRFNGPPPAWGYGNKGNFKVHIQKKHLALWQAAMDAQGKWNDLTVVVE